MTPHWTTTSPDYDPLIPGSHYTELAKNCRHVIHHSTPSELTIKLSRPATTYGPAPTWTDNLPALDFVGRSATTLLCRACEKAMREELAEARREVAELWERGVGGVDAEREVSEAGKRFMRALMRVANFEAEREEAVAESSLSGGLKREEMLKRWEEGRRVRFDVEVGGGAGERVKVKKEGEEKRVILLGLA